MIVRILTNLSRFSDSELLAKADSIVVNMTENPAFPDAQAAVQDVKSALLKYGADLSAAAGKDRALVAEKNVSRKTLLKAIIRLGLQVMSIAHGDVVKLTSSGFPLAKTPEPGRISEPTGIELKNGNITGYMTCSVKPVKHVSVYAFEYTTDVPNADADWSVIRSSKSRHQFTNLEAGKKYWFRVAAVRGNEMAYSQIASRYAQ